MNNKKRLQESAQNKHRTYLRKKKWVKIEYRRNRYRNMSEEDKLKLKVYQKEHRKNKL